MPQPTLFIDGYNLLHAAGLARDTYGPGDLERARDRLLSLLCELLPEGQPEKTVLVFDAINSPGFHGSSSVRQGITVTFPDRGVEADAVLETLIKQHSAPKGLTVVSSDHRVQRAIRRRRGTAVDSEAFLRTRRRQAGREKGPEKPPPGPVPDREVQHWMDELTDEFGGRRV